MAAHLKSNPVGFRQPILLNPRFDAGSSVGSERLSHSRRLVGSPFALDPPQTQFHKTMPGYAATPLIDLPDLARKLQVARVVVKDESSRLSLPAYKILGSAWALHQKIIRSLKLTPGTIATFPQLKTFASQLDSVALYTATDGNHGRGIAVLARQLGFDAHIYVPFDMTDERRNAISDEGATVVTAESYDDAVLMAEKDATATNGWLCADTVGASGAGAQFAHDIQDGYQTMFAEIIEKLGGSPSQVFVQSGVGALAASCIDFFDSSVRIATVEPTDSACIQISIARGKPVAAPDTFTSMAGLRAKNVSALAWPQLRANISVAIAVSDDEVHQAVRYLARTGIRAGESGAAGLAGLLQMSKDTNALTSMKFSSTSCIVLLNTEGPTDTINYNRIMANTDDCQEEDSIKSPTSATAGQRLSNTERSDYRW
jgi:diaminopropionate ammonia-lyase